MGSDPQIEEREALAKTYIPTIEKVYAGTNNDLPEANLLGELLKLISVLPNGFHLFCDPIFEPISIFCLTIFSFNEQDTVQWLKNKFNPPLANCEKCILNFTRGKCRMLQHFAIQRHVPHEHVAKFNDIVCLWRIEAVLPVLRQISTNGNTAVEVTKDIELAVFECLCNPHMLRLNKDFKMTFDVIFKFLFLSKQPFLDPDSSPLMKTFVAGVIYCWCEGTQEQIQWSRTVLKKLLTDHFSISASSVSSDILEEVNIHLLFLQNPTNWNEVVVSQFWSRLIPIFSFFEKEVFIENFEVPKNIDSLKKTVRFPIESIFKLWYNHLGKTYFEKPLEFLLRALTMFLEKLGSEFWLKIEPFTFHSILDILFDRDTFANKLVRLQNNSIPEDDVEVLLSLSGSISDMVSWTLPFYRSLTISKRIQMVKKVSMAFLRVISNHSSLKSIPKACLMNSSTALLRAVLTIKDNERAMLYDKDDFEVVLYSKTDSRALLNNPLIQDIVVRSVTNPSDIYPDLGESAISVSTSAMMVLTKCINFDILMLCQATFKLYSNKHINDIPFNQTLIENLDKKLDLRSFHDGPLLAKQLLISLKDINGLLLIPSKEPAAQKHNMSVKEFLHLCTNIVGKFADILPNQFSNILTDGEVAQGFWSCIFSSNTELYQAATNILYDTFDVEGRLEGIQAILANNLTGHVRAINLVLHQLIICEFYEPCPRAIRVLMDVVSAFMDPVRGIFSNYSSMKGDDTDVELCKFWELTWLFLDTIYRCTLKWASKYEYSELENFTKDTLDLSRSLLDSYREFSDILHNTDKDLFESVLKAVKNMLYWLRLSDSALLESCVKLIVNASDLASEKHIIFNDHLVEMMAKYGSKAKKYSNKLSEQQAREIITKARTFNRDITDSVVSEAETYLKEKALSKLSVTSSSSPSPQPGLSSESRADFLQRKAISSSITGRPKVSQPKITSFGTFQHGSLSSLQHPRAPKALSKMELTRRQLLNNRVVHPPSSSVFNIKTTTRMTNRNADSSSDESDDDIETARELFATTKSKGKGIQTVDINGKVVTKNVSAERAKLEEEYMRKRLNVDLNPFYETILQWDYCRRSEYPDEETLDHYTDVKDSFTSVSEYRNVIRPLLLLECWQGLCSARDRGDFRPFSIIVGNRTAVSDFYEVYASVTKKMIQDSGITESDLIVLAYFSDHRSGSSLTNEEFKHATNTCLAKIRTLKNTKGDNVDVTLRVHRSHKFSKFLTLRSEIHAVKVMQMTTVEREYSSLEGLEYYDLVDQILRASPTQQMKVEEEEIAIVKSKYHLNTSQAEAIVNTVAKEGFSLIQGPPGTGKTKTILGIIGYFLSTRNALPSNVIQYPHGNSSLTTEQLLKKQKILICAPSNAAVDEIVLRLKEGVYNRDGEIFTPNIVRVGRSDAVNAAIRNYTLEELVEKQIAQKNYEFSSNPELEKKFSSAVTKRRELRAKLNTENDSTSGSMSTEDIAKLQMNIRELSKELNELGKERDEIRERNSVNYRNRDMDKRNAQARILANSNVICSTLSGSAHDVLASLGVKFDTVIIDEACQCTELSSIIPLRYGGRRCIMVGDPNQLPPTVLSGAASDLKYNQSLFVRMEKNSSPYLLDVQYRMHPAISKFPSSEFYKGRLKDGPDVETSNVRPWHSCPPLVPYKFFDIVTGKEQQNSKSMSYVNIEEVRVAIELVENLLINFEKKIDFSGKIGVISPYKEQMLRMKKEFRSYFGGTVFQYVDFNTIDGFQGQEKEIIIISCVRAVDSKSGVGFLKDFRRMNVALTRAKTSMWILGHQKSLVKNKLWKHLIVDAQQRNCLEMACAGFLNPKNSKALHILEKYKSSHDSLAMVDDYNPHQRDHEKKPTASGSRYNNGTNESGKIHVKARSDKNNSASSKIASGTKKRKSSIFGGPAVADEIISSGPYIKEKGKPPVKKVKQGDKNDRHVLFSDDVGIIPELGKSTASQKPGNDSYIPSKRVNEPHQPNNSPPADAMTADSSEDENDYTPGLPSDISREANRRNKVVNYKSRAKSPPLNVQPSTSTPPVVAFRHPPATMMPNQLQGDTPSQASHQIPGTQQSNAPHPYIMEGQHDKRYGYYPQDSAYDGKRGYSKAAQGQQPYTAVPNSYPPTQPPQQFNAVRSGTIGPKPNGRKQNSSNPFIPKKRQHPR